jgi:spermidine synthase
VAVVREEDGTLWLDFGDGAVQSRMLRADPARLVLEYTRLMMGFLLFHPAPERVTMIGLGGGSLAKYCAAHLPEADFTAVEIAPEIIALRDAFGIPPDGPRFRVLCQDGATYVRADGDPLDVLIVDAFDRAGQPEDLCSAAFYDCCHDRLAPGGVLAVNLYADDPAYDVRVERIRDAFDGKVIIVDVSDAENDIVFAGTGSTFPPAFGTLVERRRALEPSHPIGLDIALRKFAQYSDGSHAVRRRRREASRSLVHRDRRAGTKYLHIRRPRSDAIEV